MENSPKRAWQDTRQWLLNSLVAWTLVAVIPVGCGVLSVLFIPQKASLLAQATRGAIGAIVGLVLFIFLVYIVHLIITPYRQRGEARDSLIAKASELKTEQAKVATYLQVIASDKVAIEQQASKLEDLDKQLNEAVKLYKPIEELADIKRGDTVKGKEINISLMFQKLNTFVLSNVTFDHCVLKGPCMIALLGNCEVSGSNLGKGRLEDMLIRADPNRRYIGVCGFANCKILYCTFENIGILADDVTVEKVKKGTVVT
jgi:biopolymer transport protein ExbD